MSGCCRIDPIHHGGIYIPAVPTPPLRLSRALFPVLPTIIPFFLAHGPATIEGGFSRADAYAATFLGALAQPPFFLSVPSASRTNPPFAIFSPLPPSPAPTPQATSSSSFFRLPFGQTLAPMQPAIVYASNLNSLVGTTSFTRDIPLVS